MNRGKPLTERDVAALQRLIRIAHGDTGQSRAAADFLLSWWNSDKYGGFALTDLWTVEWSVADDMVTVFTFLSWYGQYPDSLGYRAEFESILRRWRSTDV